MFLAVGPLNIKGGHYLLLRLYITLPAALLYHFLHGFSASVLP